MRYLDSKANSNKMKKELSDYQSWVKANKSKRFSLLDYVHAKLNFDNISPDLAVALLQLYWPTFHEVDGFVFLKEEFSEKKYREVISNNEVQLEYWMNLISIESICSSATSKVQEYIAIRVTEMWRAKLKIDFPEKSFIVKKINDETEVFCVFYQPKFE